MFNVTTIEKHHRRLLPGEGCEGRERSETAAPAPLKNNTRGRGGSDSVPRSKPDPDAARSPAERSSGGTP
ncbi:MAG: hypothetical protein NZM35_11565 [Chitinophagales bacterium]|nr:hypothetical protein [Chitinophagales bacterium]MDW8418552.1 hypothetical protein [Chitinophagales bacterium]